MREAPVYMSHMDDQELTASDPKQQFGCGVETSTTVWPEEIDCPGFSFAVKRCVQWMHVISKRLLAGFEKVLGEEPGFLHYEPGYLTFSAYPGKDSDKGSEESAGGFGLHEHSDATVFTVLTQRERALQTKSVDGSWSAVPVLSGDDLLVLPGDWMEIWTNGQVPAVRHRVADTSYERFSLAFFQNVSKMAIGPLPTFINSENPQRFPTIDSDIPYTDGDSGVPRWRTQSVESEKPQRTDT